MKKAYIVVFLIICSLLSITALSATDTNSSDNINTMEKTAVSTNDNTVQTTDNTDDNKNIVTTNTKKSIKTKQTNVPNKATNTTKAKKSLKQETLDITDTPNNEKQEITLNDGTYYINSTINVLSDVKITGQSRNNTIIIANTTHTLFNVSKGATLTLNNLTIKDYYSDESTALRNYGTLNINNCIFQNNTNTNTSIAGGNLYNEGNLTVIDSEFKENYAASRGASIFSTGGIANIYTTIFTKDNALNVGGSTYNIRGTMNIYDSTFTENSAVSGAGIYNAFGNLYVNNTKFIKNNASSFYGGAIYSTGIATVTNTLFSYNHAVYDGGAVANSNNFTAINCSFESNTAGQHGGAIENFAWTSTENGNLTLLYCNFTENMAVKNGGVIINYNTAPVEKNHGTITARYCVFKLNNAGEKGGVICNLEDETVSDSIDLEYNVFVDNEASEGNVITSPDYDIKSVEYNWWGVNSPQWQKVGVNATKWIVMTFTNTTPLVEKLETKLLVTLNTLNTGEKLNTTIPEREIIYLEGNSTYNENFQTIINNQTNTVIPEYENITAKLDSQKISLQPEIANITYTLTDNNQTIHVIYNLPDNINGKSTIKVNGKTILNKTLTIANGKQTFDYTIPGNWNKNNYTMNIILQTSTGQTLRKNITLTIPKRNITASISIINSKNKTQVGDTIQIVATIKTGNSSVTGGRVAFKINGITIKTNVAVVNGKAVINYTIPYNLNPKNYNISIVYSGTENKLSATTNTPLTIQKQDVHVSPNDTMYLMSEAGISTVFSLLDSHNNYVSSGRVCYKINGITLKTNITLSDGVFTFDYITPSVPEGKTLTQNLTIVMGENSKYNSMRLTMPIVIY